MKIIDLMNKIANKEEVPKNIVVNGLLFEYQGDDYLYKDKDANREVWLFSEGYADKYVWLENFLNTEVDVIEVEEDKKIPEKLDIKYDDIKYSGDSFFREQILMYCDNLQYKINEIIDYLQSKGENND